MRMLRLIKDLFQAYMQPQKYIRRIGVRCKGKVTLYGNPMKMFGSEPWLITLGIMYILPQGYALLPMMVAH